MNLRRSDNDGASGLIEVDGRKYYGLRRSALPSLPARAGSRRPVVAKGAGRAPLPSSRREGEVVHVRFQESASWLTPGGVAMKLKQLEKLGLPDFKGWRFITLSLDPAMFGYCPLTGYLEGKERMRRFLELGRLQGLWDRGVRWSWKLEFQKNGWAHWHLCLDRKKKFTNEEMFKVREIWGLGRTNIRRISKSAFGYQFKYVFKGVYQDDDSDARLCVPQWFMSYYSAPGNGTKPKSFARVRFWQTSKGFYEKGRIEQREKSAPQSSILPRPVSEILADRERSLIVVSRDRSANYQKSKRLRLSVDYEYFIRCHIWDAENDAGCTLSARSFVINRERIPKLIESTELCLLQPLLEQNRLTLKRAMFLRRNHKTLETC